MTPTIEEVKLVADECKIYPRHNDPEEYWCYSSALQAFAQHWIEVGRKQKADESSELLNNLNRTISNMLAANAEAIRNNAGE